MSLVFWLIGRMASMDQWYLARGKVKEGPFSRAELQAAVAKGDLRATDMVLQAGAQRWLAAGEVSGLFPAPAAEPVLAIPVTVSATATLPAAVQPVVPFAAVPVTPSTAAAGLRQPWLWVAAGGIGLCALVVVPILIFGGKSTPPLANHPVAQSAAPVEDGVPLPKDLETNPVTRRAPVPARPVKTTTVLIQKTSRGSDAAPPIKQASQLVKRQQRDDVTPDGESAESPKHQATLVLQVGHTHQVTSVAFSPDGNRVLTGSADNTARLWDAASGREIRALEGHRNKVTSVAYSPDGKQVLTGSADNTVRSWDPASGKIIRDFFGHTGSVNSVAFSPDGKHVLTGSADNTARLWDAASGREIRVFQGHTGPVHAVAFSRDGKQALTGGADKTPKLQAPTARLWDVASGREIRVFKHVRAVLSVAFSPDGKQVLTGSEGWPLLLWDAASGKELSFPRARNELAPRWPTRAVAFSPDGKQVLESFDKTARLWDTASGEQIQAFHHADWVTAVAFSPDGTQVLTGSADKLARLWKRAGRTEIRTFFHSNVTCVAFAPDGKQVLTTGPDDTARLWDADGGKETRAFAHSTRRFGAFLFAALSPDGAHVATGGLDKKARLWDAASGKRIRDFQGHSGAIRWLVFSPDGKQVLTASADHTARLWEADSGKEIRVFEGHAAALSSAAFSPDGKNVLTGSLDKTARLWERGSGKEVRAFQGHTAAVTSVAFTPDGKRVLTGGDTTVRLWDAASGKEIKALPHRLGVHAVAFSPDGRQVLTGGRNGTVRLWDATSGANTHTFQRQGGVLCVAFSPDGRQVLSGTGYGDGRAELRGIAGSDSQALRTFQGLARSVNSAAFSPDGKQVVTGSEDQTAQLWDVASGKVRHTFPHASAVRSVAFSPDGNQLLTVSGDNLARLWDVASGKQMHAFWGHSQPVIAIAFSQDGKQLVTGSTDPDNDTVRLWDTASGKQIRAFRYTLGKNDVVPNSVRSLAFSPDGKHVLAVIEGGRVLSPEGKPVQTVIGGKVLMWDAASGKEMHALQNLSLQGVTVAFSPDGKQVLMAGGFFTAGGTARLCDAASGRVIRTFPDVGPVSVVAFSPDGKQVRTVGALRVRFWDAASGKEIHAFLGHTDPVTCLAFSPDGKQVLTGSRDGTARLWSAVSGREVCRLLAFRDGTWAAVTPDNYYMAPKGALEGVAFRVGKQVFPFDQFDLKFNRPDKVLESIGLASQEMIAAYRHAYQKRLKRMNFTEEMLAVDLHLPEVAIESDGRLTTRDKTLKLKLTAIDSKYLLDRLHVYVNGVPIRATDGIDIRKRQVKTWQQEIDIELSAGKNKIDVSVLNEKGAESLKETRTIDCAAPAAKPDLYVIAVGVSDYQDTRYRLTYADKDARDLADLLENKRERFGQVKVLRILNRDATRANILKARDFLNKSQVDDQVVLFFAGHGLLDSKLDYYFATADIDFKKPAERGLPYEAVEGLLDGIKARKRLVLMDTCHSGELDKEDIKLAQSEKLPEGEVKTRSFRGLDLEAPRLGLRNSYQLLQEMFADLRRGTGAVVIASAGGAEYALESEAWKNGVFTYAVLRGLKGEADRDKDGRVRVSELRDFVQEEVRRLTRGRQAPTARRDNLDVDFTVD